MAQLGLPSSGNAAPSSGFFFDDFGNCQFWSGPYAMPAGGGIVTDINVYCAGDGASATGRLVIWDSGGGVLWQSGNITLPSGSRSIGGQGWQHATVPNIYVAAGNIYLGFWSSGNVVWTWESSGSTSFQRGLSGGPGSQSSGGTEGSGALGAYITYTPGGVARINTGTPASPVWAVGVVSVNTGTPASPVWTPARVRVNIGTPGTPNWVDAT